MKFKGYIFDMDGTLVDNGRYHILAWKEFAKRHGKTVDGQDILDWMGMTGDVYNERILGRKLTPEEQRELGEEKESLYRDIYRPHMRLPEGLLEFLKGIRASEGKCALATGGPQANADFILDGLKIREHFSAVISAGMYQRSKPDPECFLLAASLIGVVPKDCVVFEDGLPGVKAGKAAGMKVIGVAFTHPRERLLAAGADCVISGYVGVDEELKVLGTNGEEQVVGLPVVCLETAGEGGAWGISALAAYRGFVLQGGKSSLADFIERYF